MFWKISEVIENTGRVFTSSLSGRLASDNRNSVKTVAFPTRLKFSESANFSRILIEFKPSNQVA